MTGDQSRKRFASLILICHSVSLSPCPPSPVQLSLAVPPLQQTLAAAPVTNGFIGKSASNADESDYKEAAGDAAGDYSLSDKELIERKLTRARGQDLDNNSLLRKEVHLVSTAGPAGHCTT